jgi:hypothetical protein
MLAQVHAKLAATPPPEDPMPPGGVLSEGFDSGKYGGSVPQFLHAHGYGPQHSVTHDAVDRADWLKCTHCDYIGAPASIATHTRRYHPDTIA